jgi:hypothetical protein
MAKSKSFFGLRRGSTKSHTFQVLQGVQITKDRVENVANPQSAAQMLQRVVFATVTQAADKMLSIIGISQQGITNETESRRRWISQNVKKLRDAARRMQQGGAVEAAFAPKGNTQLIPNSYQMAKGSLALVPALVPKTTAQSGASFGSNEFAQIGKLATIPFGTDYSALDLWRLLFGLMAGDQLTFPQIYGEGIAQGLLGAGGVYVDKTLYTDFCAPRIVLLQSVSEDAVLDIDAQVTANGIAAVMRYAVDIDNTWYDIDNVLGNITIQVNADSIDVFMNQAYDTVFAINNDDPLRAIGCIRSHKDPSTRQWQYSTSDLVCIWQDGDRGIGDLNYFGFTLANAIDTYKKNVILDSDGNFLQRGTDDNIVPPSFQ